MPPKRRAKPPTPSAPLPSGPYYLRVYREPNYERLLVLAGRPEPLQGQAVAMLDVATHLVPRGRHRWKVAERLFTFSALQPDTSWVALSAWERPETGALRPWHYAWRDFNDERKERRVALALAALEPVIDRLLELHAQRLPMLEGGAPYTLPEWP